MTTELFAGERLAHPALDRQIAGDGAIWYRFFPRDFDLETIRVFGRLVRRDLLAAAGAKRRVDFVLDLATAPYLDRRMLLQLKADLEFVMQQPGAGLRFSGVHEDLRAHLANAGFRAVFFGLDTTPPRRTPELEL